MKVNRNNRIDRRMLGKGLGALLLITLVAFPFTLAAQTISDQCAACHNDIYQQWKVSGHPHKLMKGDIAQNRPIPLPEDHTWDEISYVIGGYKWKSRYLDAQGYIITQGKGDEPGNTQYNMLTDEWVDYHADEPNGTKPYDCGQCHTTGWVADEDAETDGDLSDNQDGLPGIHGTFEQGGIQCIRCHGGEMHADFGMIDNSAEACGACHSDGDADTIPASGGWIQNHQQYNEFQAGPHAPFNCVSCHNPHKKSQFSIKEGAACGDCHSGIMASYAQTSMYDYGVTCQDCHMPFATRSAQALGPNQGDVKTHIFYINPEPVDRSAMFTGDGSQVLLDEDGKAAVTLDFVCQRCHETASLEELSKFAKDFHDPEIGNTHVGLTSGLSGNWWGGPDRSGEGFVLSFENDPNGDLYLFASFYSYDDTGNQVYLIGLSNGFEGTTVNVDVYITSGRTWGEGFDPTEGSTDPWGSGSFTFPDCESGSVTLTPNAAAIAAGFTEISYDLSRDVGDLEHAISCPTFVDNAGQ